MSCLHRICALAFLVAAADASAFCVPGDTSVCYVNGRPGIRVCGPDGIYGPCRAGRGIAEADAKPTDAKSAGAPPLALAVNAQRAWLWQSTAADRVAR